MIKAQGLTDLQQSLSFVTRPISYSYVQKCFLNKTIRDNNVHSKSREPKTIFKNLRPICLLNVVYKLASGCIVERIKGFLDKIIHCDQTGFVKGRFIGEKHTSCHWYFALYRNNTSNWTLNVNWFWKSIRYRFLEFYPRCTSID